MSAHLVPVDFSAGSRPVISEATKRARLIQCPITFVHVVQPPPMSVSDFGPLVDSPAQVSAGSAKRRTPPGEATEQGAKGRLGGGHGPAHRPPVFPIAEFARKRRGSAIGVGALGHTAFDGLLGGSPTGGELKRSPSPVIVVPVPPTTRSRPTTRKSHRTSEAKRGGGAERVKLRPG